MKKVFMTSAAMIALFAGPTSLSSVHDFDHATLFSSAEAANAHSNGNGNSGGNGNGGNNGNAGNSSNAGSADHSNAGSNGKGNGVSDPSINDNADVTSDVGNAHRNGDALSPGQTKEKNLHAVLGRINSIGRNVDALMNSKDPHLAGIRTYILNSVELAKAQTLADSAQANYDAALADYTDAGLAGDPAATLSTLTSAVASANTEAAAALYAQIDITNALITAQSNLIAADAKVANYSVLASDAALTDALASMSNKKLTSADISAATLEWSKAVLGVGDATGAIDFYMAETQTTN